MTREIDDFLFSPSTPSAATAQAAPLEARPLAPAVPAAPAPAAPAVQAGPKVPPKAALASPVPEAPFSPSNVPTPSAASVVPEVAKAASVIRKEVPKPQAESAMSSLTDELVANWKPLAIGASAVIAAQVARSVLAGRRTGGTTPPNTPPNNPPNTPPNNPPNTPQSGAGGTGTPAPVTSPTTEGPLFATESETIAHQAALDRQAQAARRSAEFEALWAQRNIPVAPTIEPLVPAAEPDLVPNPRKNLPGASPWEPEMIPVERGTATSTALTTGQSGNAIADAVVRDELAKPAAVPPKAEPLRTGTGREVIAGEGPVKQRFDRQYAKPQDVPKGYAFVPGGQFMDTLRNALGQDLYTRELSKQAFPATYPATEELARQINRAEGRMTRAELEAAGLPKGEGTTGITRKVGPGKLVKVGGVAGALVALSDLAKADTLGQVLQAGTNLVTGIMPPPVQVGLEAIGPASVAPGTLTPQMLEAQRQAVLLGSPYAQTPEAKLARLRERAGAGRGLMNPVPPR